MDSNYQQLRWTDENKKKFWDYWDFESESEELYFTYNLGKYLVEKFSDYYLGIKNVLDYGSGRGYLIKPLLEKELNVSTLEFSERAIKEINNEYKNVDGFEGAYTIQDFNKINKKFDLIFLTEIIEHLNDDELEIALCNIRQLLNKGGIIIITTPNDERLKTSNVYCPECQKVFHRWQHVRSWNKKSLENYLNQKEFKLLFIDETDLNYEKAKLNFNWRQKISDKLTEKDREWKYKPHLVCVAQSE